MFRFEHRVSVIIEPSPNASKSANFYFGLMNREYNKVSPFQSAPETFFRRERLWAVACHLAYSLSPG